MLYCDTLFERSVSYARLIAIYTELSQIFDQRSWSKNYFCNQGTWFFFNRMNDWIHLNKRGWCGLRFAYAVMIILPFTTSNEPFNESKQRITWSLIYVYMYIRVMHLSPTNPGLHPFWQLPLTWLQSFSNRQCPQL